MIPPRPPVTMTTQERGAGPNDVAGRLKGATGMGFAVRSQRKVVQAMLVGALALTTVFGLGAHGASASTGGGSTCDSYYNAAMYAADRWRAANRSGDTINANFWWSIYNHNELAYVNAGCLGTSSAT